MPRESIDPFFETIGKYLGVPPEEIRIRQSATPGEFTCVGPRPKPSKRVPDLPKELDYCFSFVLKLDPPRALCAAYQRERDELKAQLAELVEAEEWDDVAAVAQRLSALQAAIQGTCRKRSRVITYCIFPV
jgi:hypothetical protein